MSGQNEDATRIFGGLATEHHFYGFLAAEALGASIMPLSEPLSPDPAALAAFGAREAVQRVVKLSALDLRLEAQREWVSVVRGLDDEGLLLAASYAQRNRLYDRSINTADRTQRRHDFGLRYPTPYQTEIENAARQNGLDAALVYGLVRQESRFLPDIVSSAGAVGLMQLMPPTARWVARQTGRASSTPPRLEDPDLNIEFGAHYSRYVLDKSAPAGVGAARIMPVPGGHRRGGRVAAGRRDLRRDDPVQRNAGLREEVLANAMFYQAQLGLRYVRKDRLGVAPARAAPVSTTAPQLRRRSARGSRRRPEMSTARILVLGGSGFVGRHIVARLVAAGWNVVVPTRYRERAKHLILLPTVDVVEADIHDPLALEQLAAGADAAINLVGILNERRRGDFERAHVELPRKLVAACRKVRVPRFLHMSALNAGAGTERYLPARAKGSPRRRSGLTWTISSPGYLGREDRSQLFAPPWRFLTGFASPAPRTVPAGLLGTCRRVRARGETTAPHACASPLRPEVYTLGNRRLRGERPGMTGLSRRSARRCRSFRRASSSCCPES